MKNIVLNISFYFMGMFFIMGQTQTENYVKTTTYQVKTIDGSTSVTGVNLSADDKLETITYYDGLGRPIQSINKGIGTQKEDLITPIIYDVYGRQAREYLPWARAYTNTTDGWNFEETQNVLSNLNDDYYADFTDDFNTPSNLNPFSEKRMEVSAVGKVLEQAAPEHDWAIGSENTIRFEYSTNVQNTENPLDSLNDNVKHFSVSHLHNVPENTELNFVGLYESSALLKNTIKDENWKVSQTYIKDHTTEEFKDKQGRVVLKRTFNENQPHDTYYVYDRYGNLTYVLPPTASDAIVVTGTQGFVANTMNYPWTTLINVDEKLSEEYNKKLSIYKNKDILNVDLDNKYGAIGGVSLTTYANSNLISLNINITANQEFLLKQGTFLSLNPFGKYKDAELGRIGDYVFEIKNNTIVITSQSKTPSSLINIQKTLNNTVKLTYNMENTWAKVCDVDTKFASQYESDVLYLSKSQNHSVLEVALTNSFGAQGGIGVTVDEFDIINVHFNIQSSTPLKLKNGIVKTLNLKRRLANREIGVLSGPGYEYKLSLKDNSLFVEGSGTFTSLNSFLAAPPDESVVYSVDIETVEGLCYIYRYDSRNRLVEKKVPGKGWEYIIYDVLDRPVLTQDAKQRQDKHWLFTKYDAFNRVVYTGNYTHTFIDNGNFQLSQRRLLQQVIMGQSVVNEQRTSTPATVGNTAVYYTNSVQPSNDLEIYTINYYDDYAVNLSADLSYTNSYDQTLSQNNSQLTTVNKIRVLNTNNWITNVIYYDKKARPIYSISKNDYLQTIDELKTELDFVGKILETKATHKKEGKAPIEIIDSFTYDHANRMLTQVQSINDGVPELIVNNHYDKYGQLRSKDVGGTVTTNPNQSNGLQSVDYSYNIRGWLKQINDIENLGDDLFGFKLNYNTPETPGVQALHNGNISETHWITVNDNILRNYDYAYDALNRIKQANYNNVYQGSNALISSEDYSLSEISYDKNGNITSLQRIGRYYQTPQYSGLEKYDIIDNLTYAYQPKSNKLQNVLDTASSLFGFKDQNITGQEYPVDVDYTYDINGNMTFDANKSISEITYNHLNSPTQVTVDNNNITYIYDASGVKLQKIVSEGSSEIITSYAGNYIYKKDDAGEKLQFFNHPEGYVEPNITGFDYVYQYKDHLGNVRLTYADSDGDGTIDPSTEIISEKNYYPGGLLHKGYNYFVSSFANGTAENFGYNGKENNPELGLEWMDFGARNYDPALMRWMNIDPLAEQMRRHSPYNYAFNNPIYFIDPDGMAPLSSIADDPIINSKGKIIADDGKTDGKAYAVKEGVSDKEITKSVKNGSLDYDNLIEIEGSQGSRQQMMDIANGDSVDNTIEYGGIKGNDGNWIEVQGVDGMVDYDVAADPSDQAAVDAAPGNAPIMHTHQSEQASTQMKSTDGLSLETVNVNKYQQTPSVGPNLDTGLQKNGQTSYTFGMGSSSSRQNPGGNVTIMSKDDAGNISRASIPIKNFVNPPSKRKVAMPPRN